MDFNMLQMYYVLGSVCLVQVRVVATHEAFCVCRLVPLLILPRVKITERRTVNAQNRVNE